MQMTFDPFGDDKETIELEPEHGKIFQWFVAALMSLFLMNVFLAIIVDALLSIKEGMNSETIFETAATLARFNAYRAYGKIFGNSSTAASLGTNASKVYDMFRGRRPSTASGITPLPAPAAPQSKPPSWGGLSGRLQKNIKDKLKKEHGLDGLDRQRLARILEVIPEKHLEAGSHDEEDDSDNHGLSGMLALMRKINRNVESLSDRVAKTEILLQKGKLLAPIVQGEEIKVEELQVNSTIQRQALEAREALQKSPSAQESKE